MHASDTVNDNACEWHTVNGGACEWHTVNGGACEWRKTIDEE